MYMHLQGRGREPGNDYMSCLNSKPRGRLPAGRSKTEKEQLFTNVAEGMQCAKAVTTKQTPRQ
jgi:hypothetical protein